MPQIVLTTQFGAVKFYCSCFFFAKSIIIPTDTGTTLKTNAYFHSVPRRETANSSIEHVCDLSVSHSRHAPTKLIIKVKIKINIPAMIKIFAVFLYPNFISAPRFLLNLKNYAVKIRIYTFSPQRVSKFIMGTQENKVSCTPILLI